MCAEFKNLLLTSGCPIIGLATGYVTYSNGFREDGTGYPYGTVATYHCNNGYYTTGGSSSTCQNNGYWSVNDGSCKRNEINKHF